MEHITEDELISFGLKAEKTRFLVPHAWHDRGCKPFGSDQSELDVHWESVRGLFMQNRKGSWRRRLAHWFDRFMGAFLE